MKRAVVLAGGGAKGAYEIGFWRALRELGLDYQIVTGSSVGALNGAMMAVGDYASAEAMWSRLTTEDVMKVSEKRAASAIPEALRKNARLSGVADGFVKNALEQRMDPSPLSAILEKYVDEGRVRASDAEFGLSAVEYPSMKQALITIGDIPQGRLHDYLLGSSAVFPSMEPREIGAAKYIDGGYGDNMPVGLALDMGADEVLAVDMQAFGITKPVHSDVPVRTIRCCWNLGPLLEFDPGRSARNMELGYLDTMKSFGIYEGKAYAFRRGAALRHERGSGEYFRRVFERSLRDMEATSPAALDRLILLRAFASFAGSRHMRPGELRRKLPTAAAEAAGEVFGLSPSEVWDAEAFDSELFSRYAPFSEGGEDIFQRLLRGGALARADGRELAAYVASRASRLWREDRLSADALIVFAAAPKEFLAGLYLSSLARG